MANRVANGARIYNEPWNRRTREVFYWLLFSGADSLGTQAERPGVVATMLSENDPDDPITTEQVQESIDILCSGPRPALIRYSADGRSYLVFRKWQEWQRIYFNVEPTCPMPDPETLSMLSGGTRKLLEGNAERVARRVEERLEKRLERKEEATREKLASNSQVTPEELAPTGTGTGTVSVSERNKKTSSGRNKSAAAQCPWCKWRTEHPGEKPPTPGSEKYSAKWRHQGYHDSACSILELDCVKITGKEQKNLKAAVVEHGEIAVWGWWLRFLKEPSKIGHSLAVFASAAVLQQYAEEKARG